MKFILQWIDIKKNFQELKSTAKAKKKILNCFSGTAASVLKAPHYFFLLLSENKKSCISIIIGNDHAV